MTSKRGWIHLIIVILILTLSSQVLGAQPQECNDAGGIWCSNICITPEINPESTSDCTINQEQTINLSYSFLQSNRAFFFKQLTILDTGSLKFKTSSLSIWTNYPDTGGLGGLWGSSGVNGGGFGGTGGNVMSEGSSGMGTQVTCGSDKGAPSVSSSLFSGGYSVIIAEKITLNGLIDISGFPGNTGNPPRGHYSVAGCGGGGGSGGSGAGMLVLSSPIILGNGQINAIGGNGGTGGKSNNNEGQQCRNYGSSTSPGAAGGGGGGGAGGKVLYTLASIPESIQVNAAGGTGGGGGCGTGAWSESGHPGEPGVSGGSPQLLYEPELCNNGVDDNYNGLIDMDDPDCYDMESGQASINAWDTSIRSQYDLLLTSWYDSSAFDGTDLSCGDDNISSLYSEYTSCSIIPADQCGEFPTCTLIPGKCVGGSGGSTCSDPGSFDDSQGGCLSSAPQSCYIDQTGCAGYYTCNDLTSEASCNVASFAGCTYQPATCVGEIPPGECYPSAPYPCTSLSDSTSCNANSMCYWSEGVPPWTWSGCNVAPGYLCSESETPTSCSTKEYCDWGIPPCSINPLACNKWTDQTMCELNGDLCYWNLNSCQLNTSTTLKSCVESSYNPQSGMCAALTSAGLCTQFITGSDLGFILPDQAYACFDNKKPADGSLSAPGNNFTWRSADLFSQQSPYTILQVDRTHFISNNVDWNYCDASGFNLFGSVGNLSEGQSFIPEFSDGKLSCISTVSLLNTTLGGSKKVKATVCDLDIGSCITQAEISGDTAFCKNINGVKATYKLGEFLDTCGPSSPEVCMIRTDGGWKSLEQYYNENNAQEWCTIIGELEPLCTGTGVVNNFISGDGIINSELCNGRDTSACLPIGYDPTKSCQEIITGQSWTYLQEDRLCTQTSQPQYCKNGVSVFSAENLSSPTCCYGENAYCEEFTDAQCTVAGGELLPNFFSEQDILDKKIECLGNNPEGTTCCIGGKWVGDANAFMGDLDINNSFVCYQEGQGNYLKECCGTGLCYNSPDKNPLSQFYSQIPSGLYSLAGSRLHNLMTFDVGQENKFKLVTNKPGNSSYDLFKGNQNYYLTDWSGFDTLEFDISFNLPYVENITIIDGNSQATNYRIKDYVTNGYGLNRWLHVNIPLDKNNAINWNNISTINFTLNGSSQAKISMLFDNFVLSDSTGILNTENYYCAGDWKQWIKNLDGTTDKGFFDRTEQPELSEFGPYQYACDSTASFGWTGKLCCGDDTRIGSYGEYYVDGAGACWNGTVIVNDQTVSYALGSSQSTLDEASLLYFDDGSANKLWACNQEASTYNNYLFSFNGTNTESTNYGQYAETSDIFTIKGSWMCQDGGWVKLDKVNRITLIASALKDYAQASGNTNKYTLMCGDYKDLSNVIPVDTNNQEMPFINYTQKACVLRLGKNADVKSDRIVIGLELDPSIILSDYNLVLKFYTPFGDRTSLTCLNAPSNPEASNFFTPCEELSGDASEFKFYYNKPFNILVMGDSYIESNAFSNNLLLTMWTNFIQFFSRLFDTGISKPLPQDLTANPKITDFYIAVQGEKSITGIMEGGNNRIDVRVDYENLHSSVAILEKAAKANYPSITSEYYASGYNQTIYINGTSKPGWKLFTGLLRLNKDEGAPTFFDDVNYIPSSD